MEKIYEKNGNILYVLNVLKKYSDTEHLLSINEMIKLIKKDYDMNIDSRTIRRNIALLKEKFDYDIVTWNENRKGYYIIPNPDIDFESGELRAIIDTFSYASFVSENISREIINKCKNMQNIYESAKLKDYRIYSDNIKTINKEVIKNIEDISNAIYNKQKLSFDYYKYELTPKLENKKQAEYIISPYAIIYSLQELYVIGLKNGWSELRKFRIDRIKNIKLLNEKVSNKINAKCVDEFVKSSISMYGSKGVDIEAICDMSLLDNVIDVFGKDTKIGYIDDKHFKLFINKDIDSFKRYVLRNLDLFKVIKPKELKVMIDEIIKGYLNE